MVDSRVWDSEAVSSSLAIATIRKPELVVNYKLIDGSNPMTDGEIVC